MKAVLYTLIFFLANNAYAQSENPIELGKISWLRNYSDALDLSAEKSKPIFLLFQEVPGCATCRNYGEQVLSDGLLVDAIEHEFIPLVIHNNKGGHDKDVLELYNEPSWNNPVVRIINKNGDDVIKRISGDYTVAAVATAMLKALEKEKKKIPLYLKLLKEERSISAQSLTESYFSMYCFWSGEGHLGSADGVIKTNPGFMGGQEVVRVVYDEEKISKKELSKFAKKSNCSLVKRSKFREDKDPQYYLKNSKYKHLPLSPMQRTKINSAIAAKENPEKYLSPSQKQWKNEIQTSNKNHPMLYTDEINEVWWKM